MNLHTRLVGHHLSESLPAGYGVARANKPSDEFDLEQSFTNRRERKIHERSLA